LSRISNRESIALTAILGAQVMRLKAIYEKTFKHTRRNRLRCSNDWPKYWAVFNSTGTGSVKYEELGEVDFGLIRLNLII